MNTTHTPQTHSLRCALAELGFRPAMLDCATMTIHLASDALAVPARSLVMEGFERGGFFYTRESAERAAREWV